MCDFQKRKALDYHSDRKKMRFIKKSRWETPVPKSTTYWNEVCNNIEKKVRKVRDPFFHFPYISQSNNNLDFDPHDSAEFNNLSKVQSYNEPIVKISPPTPSHKSFFKSSADVHQDKKTFDNKYANLDQKLILKFRSFVESRKKNVTSECASVDKTDFPKSTFFSKKTCPYHKNEPPTLIFDDNLKKFLPRRNSSAEEILNKKLVDPKLEKIVSRYSGLQSSDSKKIDNVFEIYKYYENVASSEKIDSKLDHGIEEKPLFETQKTKTPNLGKASLFASFAKTISIPSSIETRESSDEDYSKSHANIDLTPTEKYDSELRSSQTVAKDYLRVPKLGYASQHPSFRKLIPTDSFPDHEEIINYRIPKKVSECSSDFQSAENLVDPEILNISSLLKNSSDLSSVSSSHIERKIDSKISHDIKKGEAKSEKLPKKKHYSTRYAYRALKLVTKNKYLRLGPEVSESKRGSLESSSSSSLESGYKIRSNKKSIIDSSAYRSIRDELRRVAPKYLGQNYHFASKKSESETKTIVSATRSTSGSSPAFQIPQLKSNNLIKIPSIKVYPRKNADRCLPCLYESFKKPEDLKRELPRAILSSVAKKTFKDKSESDTSSVSLPDLKSPDFESIISDRRSNLESNLESRLVSSKSEMTLKDEAVTISKFSDNDSTLSRDQSLSPKSRDLKKVSIKSGSVHSTDVSKPSTPSGQSSESEDARPEVTNESLNTSKYLAPCHAPVVWKPSLESLKALRLRKATSMQSRASATTSKSDDDSDLEDSLIEIPSTQGTRKRDRKASCKSVTIRSPDLKLKSDKEDSESKSDLEESLKDKRKTLTRIKTIAEKFYFSEAFELDNEKKARLARAQTSLDLSSKHSGARKMSVWDSYGDSITCKEEFLMFRQDSRDEGRLYEMSEEEKEVFEILERCVEEGESPEEILKKLCDWYSKRVSEVRKGDTGPDLKKALRISINLLRLLAESKRYLNSDKLSSDLEFSSKQPPLCNSRQLKRVLPLKSYNLVAPILNMPQWQPKKSVERRFIFAKDKDCKKDGRDRRRSSEIDFDLFVHPPSVTEPSLRVHSPNSQGLNPYALFLVKPRRKVVTWRPLKKKDLKGYNPDATLSMRASKITDKICHDFCEWLRGLSGSSERIDEEVLKDMFQIIFTADACKSMEVIIKEMPTVPRQIALIRNSPSATELEMTRKELMRDIKIEKKPKKTFAFGSALPKHLRFVPPQNQVDKKWFLCENVPQELESMDVVWNGIKHLKSVKGFVNWLKMNTSVAPPDILDIKTDAVSVSRFSQEDMITQMDFEGKSFY